MPGNTHRLTRARTPRNKPPQDRDRQALPDALQAIVESAKQLRIDPKILEAVAALDPKYRKAITARLSGPDILELGPEIVAICREVAGKKRRGPGRPPLDNKLEILEDAARAKIFEGKYSHIATRWKISRSQLKDLIRNNKKDFRRFLKGLRKIRPIKHP